MVPLSSRAMRFFLVVGTSHPRAIIGTVMEMAMLVLQLWVHIPEVAKLKSCTTLCLASLCYGKLGLYRVEAPGEVRLLRRCACCLSP